MDVLKDVDVTHWDGPFPAANVSEAASVLEGGRVLFAGKMPFPLKETEQRFLSPDCLDDKSKNVSFRPASGAVQGTRLEAADRTQMLEMLRRFYTYSRGWLIGLCPSYRDRLIDGFTTFRPAEIEGRVSSWRKDDTRLHVDAFPSRPLQGRRILRVFSNVNPKAPRIWRVGEEFENVAVRFLPAIRPPFPGSAWLLHTAGITKDRRTPYDHYMLGLHDRMKADDQYQAQAPQSNVGLPPGSSWACFTDLVSHAAMAGQFAFEQTFYLPVEAMQEPARSPLRVLERLSGGRALV